MTAQQAAALAGFISRHDPLCDGEAKANYGATPFVLASMVSETPSGEQGRQVLFSSLGDYVNHVRLRRVQNPHLNDTLRAWLAGLTGDVDLLAHLYLRGPEVEGEVSRLDDAARKIFIETQDGRLERTFLIISYEAQGVDMTIRPGETYLIEPPNPRKKRNRGRLCTYLSYAESRRGGGGSLRVRFLDDGKQGRVEPTDLVPAPSQQGAEAEAAAAAGTQ